ncbi:MAG TPA: arylamine N-acetyltransferase [Blastocatellia bacterium]|nr:arylamine N-acetyltransferase [Blastocatellia bacterium]
MDVPNETSSLHRDLCDLVLTKLGFTQSPSLDYEGLRSLYRAWCAHVPFDNVRKMIALRTESDGSLPGIQAEEFFENWLTLGAGGTCWPTSNALFALLCSLGFETRRVAGSMLDLGIINHASVKVRLAGVDWLVDSSMLCNTPLPLDQNAFISDDLVFAIEVEPVEGTHVIWADLPPNSTYMPCRLLVDPASLELYQSSYEASRKRSPFNERLYARRNRPQELLVLLGNTRIVKTATGVTRSDLSSEGVCQVLHEEIGFAEPLLEQWIASGSLAASCRAPTTPKPPPITQKPPSQR